MRVSSHSWGVRPLFTGSELTRHCVGGKGTTHTEMHRESGTSDKTWLHSSLTRSKFEKSNMQTLFVDPNSGVSAESSAHCHDTCTVDTVYR